MGTVQKWKTTLLALLFVTLVTIWLEYPLLGMKLESALQRVLRPLSVLLILGTATWVVYRWYRINRSASTSSSEGLTSEVTRRSFLSWLILGVGAIGLSYSLFRSLAAKNGLQTSSALRVLKPRFRWRKRAAGYISKLDPGFYVNTKSQIIHYVEEDNRIRCVSNISESRLKRVDPTTIRINTSRPLANQACASYSFERAAISYLQQKNPEKACQLLLFAISQDLRPGKRPSFRLYDLLAGIAVRFDKKTHLMQMIHLIDSMKDTGRILGDVPSPTHNRKSLLAGTGSRRQGIASSVTVSENRANQDRNHETPNLAPSLVASPTVAPQFLTSSRLKADFADRIKKWKDPNNSWHRRWGNRSEPITWKVDKFTSIDF